VLAQSENPRTVATPTITTTEAAGHRLWILAFDVSSMSALEASRARLVAGRWVDASLGPDDFVAIVSIGRTLTTLQNFTSDPALARSALGKVMAAPTGDAAAGAVDERDVFNNDLRYKGLHAICSGLSEVVERKAIVFFTALKARPGTDNQAEIRAATEACKSARTSINPVDVGNLRIGG
jgi:VWFA-related protein